MTTPRRRLSLADLEAFDTQAPAGGARRRFCCPLCGYQKPRDAEHRSLSLNVSTGLWCCFRCGAAGCLTVQWRSRSRAIWDVRSGLLPTTSPPEPARVFAFDWSAGYDGAASVVAGPAARYLLQRSIPTDLAASAQVRFTTGWYGRPAILFPLCNRSGEVVAVCGRHIDNGTPKVHTGGKAGQGIFDPFAALQAPRPVIVESPLCAVSLAQCGIPALALGGTVAPNWLSAALAFHRVAVALDADEAGDRASTKLMELLRSFGCRAERWRPSGAKDWNDLLQREGEIALRDAARRAGYGIGGHLVAAALTAGGRFATVLSGEARA